MARAITPYRSRSPSPLRDLHPERAYFLPQSRYLPSVLTPAGRGSGGRSATHAAIWVREVNPSLAKMLATCRAAVVGLMDSSAAIALLLRPLATSAAIWCSRRVSELGGAAATRYASTTARGRPSLSSSVAGGRSRASATAASLLRASPRAHSRATAASPRRRAGAR